MSLPNPRRVPKQLKTYDDWRREGMQVQKGQKAHMIIEGEVLFAEWQVKPRNYGFESSGYSYDEDWEGSESETFAELQYYPPGPFGPF